MRALVCETAGSIKDVKKGAADVSVYLLFQCLENLHFELPEVD